VRGELRKTHSSLREQDLRISYNSFFRWVRRGWWKPREPNGDGEVDLLPLQRGAWNRPASPSGSSGSSSFLVFKTKGNEVFPFVVSSTNQRTTNQAPNDNSFFCLGDYYISRVRAEHASAPLLLGGPRIPHSGRSAPALAQRPGGNLLLPAGGPREGAGAPSQHQSPTSVR
jgi:hypothetical protein